MKRAKKFPGVPGEFQVTAAPPNHCSVMWADRATTNRVGIGSVDFTGEFWWVARVNVPEAGRGKGVGKKLVELLLKNIRAMGGGRVVVAPGGYGSDPRDLERFYASCGFKTCTGEKDLVMEVLC